MSTIIGLTILLFLPVSLAQAQANEPLKLEAPIQLRCGCFR